MSPDFQAPLNDKKVATSFLLYSSSWAYGMCKGFFKNISNYRIKAKARFRDVLHDLDMVTSFKGTSDEFAELHKS